MPGTSDRSHWDAFWTRDRSLEEIYDNDDRIREEVCRRSDPAGLLVLEVGAATARDSISLASRGATAVALDYSHEALRRAGEAASSGDGSVLLVCGDAEALPFREGCFDLVFHQGVMEHFRDPGPLLEENSRVTRAGGTLLVDVPQTFHVYTVVKKIMIALGAWFAGWETQYTTARLSTVLGRHGFEPRSVYARFFSPSLGYRILREALIRLGVKLPLRPVLVPPVHRLRARMRRAVEGSFLGPHLGCVIGMFAVKGEPGVRS